MRGPSSVSNTGGSVERLGLQLMRKIVELSLSASADELTSLDRADSGRIVPPIFEPLEPIEQPLRDIAVPDDSNNSTHGFWPD